MPTEVLRTGSDFQTFTVDEIEDGNGFSLGHSVYMATDERDGQGLRACVCLGDGSLSWLDPGREVLPSAVAITWHSEVLEPE